VKACVASTEFDVLLVDLIDDRFHLLEHRRNCFATASTEFVKALGETRRGRRVSNDSDEFSTLWMTGFTRFLQLLEHHQQTHKLRINRVFWSDRDVDGNGVHTVDAQSIKDANARLGKRYEQMASLLPPTAFYDYPEACFVADANHRWGLSPYHYAPPFYGATVAHLRRETR
jgi:hypothetical protein